MLFATYLTPALKLQGLAFGLVEQLLRPLSRRVGEEIVLIAEKPP